MAVPVIPAWSPPTAHHWTYPGGDYYIDAARTTRSPGQPRSSRVRFTILVRTSWYRRQHGPTARLEPARHFLGRPQEGAERCLNEGNTPSERDASRRACGGRRTRGSCRRSRSPATRPVGHYVRGVRLDWRSAHKPGCAAG